MEIRHVELRNTGIIAAPFSMNFTYTGTLQSFTVPSGITKLRVTARGAGGTSSYQGSSGGRGTILSTIITVTPLASIYVVVGGTGDRSTGTNNWIPSPMGGGGAGGQNLTPSGTRNGGAGGGYTGLFTDSSLTQNSALIIAGGGGGAGGFTTTSTGGNSGYIYPGNAFDGSEKDGNFGINAGRGATITSGGAAGAIFDPQAPNLGPTAGTVLEGGRGGSITSSSTHGGGGGGGGGYYGGGGAAGGGDASGGGGGGSSFCVTEAYFNPTGVPPDTHGSILVEALQEMNPVIFTYTGNIQYWTVPNNVNSVKITAVGANGSNSSNGGIGGNGGVISSIVPVTSGSNLSVVVGGVSPTANATNQGVSTSYGFGGNGGKFGSSGNYYSFGGAGGGLSGIFTSLTPTFANSVVIAGGGGGASGQGTNYNGGAGGGGGSSTTSPEGEDGGRGSGNGNGKKGTLTSGGAGGSFDSFWIPQNPVPQAGSQLSGGNGGQRLGTPPGFGGGGGGAGYYGGGGGVSSGEFNRQGGGGGGSSYSSSIGTNKTLYGSASVAEYYYTGTLQEYVVPSNVNQLRVTAVGASGGAINTNDVPGSGANITSVVNVTPGSTVYVYVGRCPGRSYYSFVQLTGLDISSTAGAGVGGLGGNYYDTTTGFSVVGAGGGGFSGVFTSNAITQANALIVAGGGGGASSTGASYKGGNGGTGPLGSGQNGSGGIGVGYGRGATNSVGGAPGTVDAAYPNQTAPVQGQPLFGGSGGSRSVSVPGTTGYGGGGGGAGYYGGGGGVAGGPTNRQGGGGGGSSWSSNATITYNSTLNGDLQHGKVFISPLYQYGNGFIRIEQIS